MPELAIIAESVRVTAGKALLLDDISFTIDKGTVVGLIGPSGAGKTTLMRAIVGRQRTDRGKLEIDGLTAGASALRPRIGYAAQQTALYEDLSVVQNMSFFAKILSAPQAQTEYLLGELELSDFSQRSVASLSGGQRSRLSIAVSLLGKPRLLVLDEPTVGLDPVLRKKLWAYFRKVADNGTTILVSSHVMDEAEHCDKILFIRQGRCIAAESPGDLLRRTHSASIEESFIAMSGVTT